MLVHVNEHEVLTAMSSTTSHPSPPTSIFERALPGDQRPQASLRDQVAALERLLPPSHPSGTVSQESLKEILRRFQTIDSEAAAHNLAPIRAASQAAIRLLEDARERGYNAADHGYVADVVVPFLKRVASPSGEPASAATAVRADEAVLRASTDALFQNFYDYVSATQRIRKRMDSFRDARGYHGKDLFYIRRLLRNGPRVARVLDVGCCGTVYPELFDLDCVDYVGVDVSRFSLDRMAAIYTGRRIRWLKDDATTLGTVENGAFDLILATQVLEHLPEPDKALAAMVSKLCPGGRLMVGTESALAPREQLRGRLRRLLSGLSLLAGGYYLVHGMFPYVFPHRELHSYIDLAGEFRTVSVPHFHFHPLFFERVLREQSLPARVAFLRVSGLISLARFSVAWHYRVQELKAKLPVLRFLGGQVFAVIEKTA